MDKDRHPCFNAEVRQQLGRIHLPVAPKCNIQCNYCNRLYDCPNEGRPGVTSRLFSPVEAYRYFCKVIEKVPNISVVGIAGPGDPLANAAQTFETMRLIRNDFPKMLFCLSTNGLALMDFVGDIKSLGISHITITVNAMNPKVGKEIIPWINFRGKKYTGTEAAEILFHRQMKAIKALKFGGVTVKVNTVVIPGKNDSHIPEIVKKMKELEVDILNLIPVYPAPGSAFEKISEPPHSLMSGLRARAASEISLMKHCGRCRADAVGLLGKDRSSEFMNVSVEPQRIPRKMIAVASSDGHLVNQHFGHARRFLIYEVSDDQINFVEERKVENFCMGPEECLTREKRLLSIVSMLKDCRWVLVSRIGPYPKRKLVEKGIQPVVCYDSITEAVVRSVNEDMAIINRQSI